MRDATSGSNERLLLDPAEIPIEIHVAASTLEMYAAKQGWHRWMFSGIASRDYCESLLSENTTLKKKCAVALQMEQNLRVELNKLKQ